MPPKLNLGLFWNPEEKNSYNHFSDKRLLHIDKLFDFKSLVHLLPFKLIENSQFCHMVWMGFTLWSKLFQLWPSKWPLYSIYCQFTLHLFQRCEFWTVRLCFCACILGGKCLVHLLPLMTSAKTPSKPKSHMLGIHIRWPYSLWIGGFWGKRQKALP